MFEDDFDLDLGLGDDRKKKKGGKGRHTVSIDVTVEQVEASSRKEAEKLVKQALARSVKNDPKFNVAGKVRTDVDGGYY